MTGYVTVYVRADGAPSENEDLDVPGTYMLKVDADLSVPDRASAALDCFHDTVPVGMLDDFAFTVYDSDGNEIEEGESPGYGLTDRAVYCGQVSEIPAPPGAAPKG